MEQETRKGFSHRLHQLDLEQIEIRYEAGKKYSEQYVMEKKLAKLKQRRDELKKLLQIKPKQVLQDFAKKKPPRSPKKSPNETVAKVMRSVTRRRLQEQCKAYRLTGTVSLKEHF
ncbi:uncharacterized protein LOC102808182 [Saccoglossus kowalevskii]|uniref:Uncharacterized protein LOC102808182 n=1 Tax=Saccoglossus kowalevskii TaxID=10224 RepID=A0ABM0MHI3_SACKO|nr:PREDICTED: uncharacterized protein LOC102808182 [Saccoglossus kowalevskii]